MNDISRIIELIARGECFCLATIIASGDPDIPVGRKMIVFEDGVAEGGLGDARLDAAVCDKALETLAEKNKRAVEIAPGIRVFLDIPVTDARLVVCGAGHIAVPLARFTRDMGFRVTVVDDRADFAHAARFPGCMVLVEDFSIALRTIPLDASTYVVVITRGHERDAECLAEILPKNTAYVGLIGSRRRVRFVLDLLGRQGIPRQRLDEVFTPIGLPIGSETPEEIALSIAAELVCVRRQGPRHARLLRSVVEGTR